MVSEYWVGKHHAFLRTEEKAEPAHCAGGELAGFLRPKANVQFERLAVT